MSPALSHTGAFPVIKQVGVVNIQPNHRAICHCGMVELELDLPDGLVDPKRCNCSICRRKGAVMAYVPLNGLRILRGAEHLKLYQFNSGVAKHYFCSNCGIYTHHQTRSNPTVYGFNVGCWKALTLVIWMVYRLATVSTMNLICSSRDRGSCKSLALDGSTPPSNSK